MSELKITEADIQKLREWVDEKRVEKPAEEPKAAPAKAPAPKPHADLPEQVSRVSRIAESIHKRREERARLIADGNSKRVAFEAQTRADKDEADRQFKAIEKEIEERCQKIRSDLDAGITGRNWELSQINDKVQKIDVSLEQLRKQLDVELRKLDPEREVSK